MRLKSRCLLNACRVWEYALYPVISLPGEGLCLHPLLGAAQAGEQEMRAGASALGTSLGTLRGCLVHPAEHRGLARKVFRIEVKLQCVQLTDPTGRSRDFSQQRVSASDSEPWELRAQGPPGRARGILGPACVRRRGASQCPPHCCITLVGSPGPLGGAQETPLG